MGTNQTHRNGTVERVGLVACGALAREVLSVVEANGFDHVETRFLPAGLHNTPQQIPQAVDEVLAELAQSCSRLLVGYADCGTGGRLEPILEKHGATRIEGAHCYAFYSGLDVFDARQDAEPGTFYLTDFLARQFDTLVWKPLALDRHPELRDAYFGNYTRLMFLSQSPDPDLERRARDAAERLGLRFEHHHTGLGGLSKFIEDNAA